MAVTKNKAAKRGKNRRDAHGVRERRVPEKEFKPRTGRRDDFRRSERPNYNNMDLQAGYNEQPERNFLIGRNPVIEALRAGSEVEKVFIAEGSEGSISLIKALAKENGVIIDVVDRVALNRMVPGEKHQGVIAEIPAYKYSEVEDIFAKAERSGEDPFIILLDEIEDPHNLGAVIRTAECAGAHGVIIPKRRACGITGTVAKSAAGAIETIPVARVTNMARTIEELQERGIWIAACDMDGDTYYDANLSGPIAIVIGNEGRGISRIVREKCDFVVSIPMKGKINSLNASNAAAIIMYEIRRRRELGGK